MNDRELAEALLAGEHLGDLRKIPCPCGILVSAAPAFHRRQQDHDCIHHPRHACATCRSADRMLAGIEARLWTEVEHGPFIVTRWV